MFLGNRPWANKPFYGHIKLFLLQSIFNATDLKYATVLLGSNALIKWQLSILTKRLFARIWQASMMSHDNSTCSELFSSLVSPASFPVTGSVCAYMRLCLVRKFWAVTAAPSSYLGGSMAELDVGSRRNWFCETKACGELSSLRGSPDSASWFCYCSASPSWYCFVLCRS